MIKNIRIIFLFVLAVVVLSSCLKYAPTIYPDDVLEPGKGYLYGRFSDENRFNFVATQMGVVVTSVDKKQEIALRFESNLDLYAVAVDPGDYQATHIIFTQSVANDIKGQKPFPEELVNRIIHVEAGKAYYIGDFNGASKSTFVVLSLRGHKRQVALRPGKHAKPGAGADRAAGAGHPGALPALRLRPHATPGGGGDDAGTRQAR